MLMLSLERLKILHTVATAGSFTAAARRLSFTQSAVSQHIASLERTVGMRLVERGPRGVTLTEAGAVLVEHAETMLRQLHRAEREIEALALVEKGHVRLATFTTAGAALVPPAIATFRARHPGIVFDVRERLPWESEPLLLTGELDLALGYDFDDRPYDSGPDFDWVHLLDDPHLCALHQDHPLAAAESVDLGDLAAADWIGAEELESTPLLRAACAAVGFEPAVAYATHDYGIVQGLVAAGLGVALMPQIATIALHPAVVVRPITTYCPVRRVGAILPSQRWHSPVVSELLTVLHEVAADLSGPAAAVVHSTVAAGGMNATKCGRLPADGVATTAG